MCNHTSPGSVKFSFDYVTQKFVVRAITDLEVGDEVCTSYTNDELNQRLFLSYGFLSETGYYNVFLTLELRADDPLYELKESFYHPLDYSQCFRLFTNLSKKNSQFD